MNLYLIDSENRQKLQITPYVPFFGRKTPKNVIPTKSTMSYKMVPIAILQMQMSKILYFCITAFN